MAEKKPKQKKKGPKLPKRQRLSKVRGTAPAPKSKKGKS
jgi:hypothetical protein